MAEPLEKVQVGMTGRLTRELRGSRAFWTAMFGTPMILAIETASAAAARADELATAA